MNSKPIALFIAAFLISVSLACPDDSLCLQCRNSLCTVCAYSYPNSSGICTRPTNVIPGCYIYSSNTVCAKCQNGYYFNPLAANTTQICVALDYSVQDVCLYSLSSATSCTHCKNNVLQNGGACIPWSFCADPNCESCYVDKANGLQACHVCKEGFSLWTGVYPAICIATPTLKYCSEFLIPDQCDACGPGSYWQNGRCEWNRKTLHGSAGLISQLTLFALMALFLKN